MTRTPTLLLAATILAGCATTSTTPQAGTGGPTCDTPAHAAMDFWVGDWEVTWTDQQGNEARGSNHIDRDAYSGCVVTERFDGRPGLGLQGMSVSVYDVAADTWRQTWVDNQGGYIALAGGPQPDGSFLLETANIPNQPRFRMTWTDIREDGFTWRWQRRQPGASEWEDRWVIDYTRR